MKSIFMKIFSIILVTAILTVLIMPFLFVYMHIHLPKLPNFATPADRGMKYENIQATTSDDITLQGWYIPNKQDKGTVLVCHGVSANRADVLSVAQKFHNGGYEIYMFDFRGHGESDKAKVTYGYDERKDIKAIVNFMKARGVEKLGIFGLSMGGAIVLLSTPENPEIKAVIVDSAFASAEKVMKYRICMVFPATIANFLYKIGEFYTNLFYGAAINEITPIDIVGNINRPILFIVGSSDTNITPDNGYMLFKKATEPKELYVVEGADHTETISDENYEYRINKFMDTYLK
jgi:alpha-beta hydrolase superfamily lysophospholipase